MRGLILGRRSRPGRCCCHRIDCDGDSAVEPPRPIRGSEVRRHRWSNQIRTSLGDPQFRASRSGVDGHFLGRCHHGFSRQDGQSRIVAERHLHPAIFQRVEADDGRSAAGLEPVGKFGQGGVEVIELGVDRDPQRLEDPRRRVDPAPLTGNALADESPRGVRWSRSARSAAPRRSAGPRGGSTAPRRTQRTAGPGPPRSTC